MSDPTQTDPNLVPPNATAESRAAMPIEEFTALASKLVSLALYKDAIGLYEAAVRSYPENLALKINLARVRDMKLRSDEQVLKDLKANIQDRRGREDLLAQHGLGLGYYHYRRNEIEKARELFELTRACNDNLYSASVLLARIHVSRNELDEALTMAEEARRANPYCEEAQSLAGRLHFERGDDKRALTALLNALQLSGCEIADRPFYRRYIVQVLERLGLQSQDLPRLLRERQSKFAQRCDGLERRRRERMAGRTNRLSSIFAALSQKAVVKPSQESQRLRRFLMLERVSDDDLQQLYPALTREEHPAGAIIFSERETNRKLCFVDAGEISIRRNTPFGEVPFATYVAGQVCGEMDFLDGLGHSADAVCTRDTVLLTLTRTAADKLFARRRAFAVQCLSYFWRSLAEHIRTTNEQMKSFFVNESMAAERTLDEKLISKAEKVIIDIQRKIALFREQGLSAGELSVLATLSTEERYSRNDLIFSEGEPGSKLYVVLDGKVRIGKRIPGVGEEALAILEPGDFFGEMALVDDKPRSADAWAHEAGTTILAIDKRVLDDILTHDLTGAERFLTIVCRILCQRLREINETIVKWKIMSGGF